MCSESTSLVIYSQMIAVLFLISAAIGIHFNGLYLLKRRGDREVRALKMVYSISSAIVAIAYFAFSFHASFMQMPVGGVILSIGFLGFHLVVTVGMVTRYGSD